MALIAEGLMLLLLDNAAAEPALEPDRRRRVLAAGVLLDLALSGHLRPSLPSDGIAAHQLLVLANGAPVDPVGTAALRILRRRPLDVATAVARIGRTAQDDLLDRLARTGQLRPTPVGGRGRTRRAWPIADRSRVSDLRSALRGTLLDGRRPRPVTAAVITVLHSAHALDVVFSLNRRDWEWVRAQAADVAAGNWVDETAAIAEVNLAVTAATLRPALA